jgi:hypothetical protein
VALPGKLGVNLPGAVDSAKFSAWTCSISVVVAASVTDRAEGGRVRCA